ncbi:MAG TPA: TraR/DksA C4-type zinc finger protein [Verrucomicrobiae bacterium]|nr:TraR/DksA C4-type zinc finger protein [Verrucomicrobiae bacterium]
MAGKTSKSKKAAPKGGAMKRNAKPAQKAHARKVAPKGASKPKAPAKGKAPATKLAKAKPAAAPAPAKPASPAVSVNHVARKSVSATSVTSGRGPVLVESVSRPARRVDDVPFEQSDDYRPEPSKPVELTAFLRKQKQRLEELKDHLLDQMQDVSRDNLRAAPDLGGGSAFGQHMGDAGSDAYEKDFALSLLSQEQDSLYEIDEALKRIHEGNYGICEKSGKRIPHERLEAIPWARLTVECQAEMERARKGHNKWESQPHFMDVAESGEEDEDEESEEEPRARSKEQQQ